MGSRELSEWAAYEKATGVLGQERDDALFALLAAVTVNLWAKKPRKWTEFLPQWRKKKQTPEQLDAAVEMLNRTFGGS